MGLSLKWDITYRCNLFCEHCINGNLLNNTKKEPSYEEMKQIIDNFSEKTIDYIHLLGGEPTIRKNFIEIMHYLNMKKICFGFNTNGLTIGSYKILHAIGELKMLRNIIFSIEGPMAEINDLIRGKEVFEKVLANLKKLIAYKMQNNLDYLRITVNTVVSQANKTHIMEMIKFCIGLGVDELVFLQLIPEGNAQGKNMSLSFEDELKLITDIADIYPDIKEKIDIIPRFVRPMAIDYVKKVLQKEFPGVTHGCGAGTDFAYLSNQGDLYPCNLYRNTILEDKNQEDVSLLNNSFDDIWKENKYSDIFRYINKSDYCQNIAPCNSCEHLREDCYLCPAELMANPDQEIVMEDCRQYYLLIEEHSQEKRRQLQVIKSIIRESIFDEETYVLFNTETLETLSLNKEAYLIWDELKTENSFNYDEIIKSIKEKYPFDDGDIEEVIDYLYECHYLEGVANVQRTA
ncbi:MAG: PqqD family peptide modification chaperone [Lachnospiraceae bacterium]|nr:PqqD family peptide modification chaperone [Lachnospiraceae bacterium]